MLLPVVKYHATLMVITCCILTRILMWEFVPAQELMDCMEHA